MSNIVKAENHRDTGFQPFCLPPIHESLPGKSSNNMA